MTLLNLTYLVNLGSHLGVLSPIYAYLRLLNPVYLPTVSIGDLVYEANPLCLLADLGR